jgi:hypothetical protein
MKGTKPRAKIKKECISGSHVNGIDQTSQSFESKPLTVIPDYIGPTSNVVTISSRKSLNILNDNNIKSENCVNLNSGYESDANKSPETVYRIFSADKSKNGKKKDKGSKGPKDLAREFQEGENDPDLHLFSEDCNNIGAKKYIVTDYSMMYERSKKKEGNYCELIGLGEQIKLFIDAEIDFDETKGNMLSFINKYKLLNDTACKEQHLQIILDKISGKLQGEYDIIETQ